MRRGPLQATTLTFPVVVAEIGRSLGPLAPATSAALIGAALLSVVLFPAAALALRPWSGAQPAQPSLGAAVIVRLRCNPTDAKMRPAGVTGTKFVKRNESHTTRVITLSQQQ